MTLVPKFVLDSKLKRLFPLRDYVFVNDKGFYLLIHVTLEIGLLIIV